ncbi:MAG TPA: universal stress protein [Thermoanaerobaculia bacterium]|nr:universal stress protein [Thermoanaerobaculia bacterium]
MFTRILIPTDFSTASEWVFDDAVRIAGSSAAEVLILHVRRTWASHPDELRFPADPSLYEYAEQLELERLRDRVRRANASVTTRMIVKQAPDPGNEICRTAKAENVDLIVIATHARHHVAHLLVGSTTLTVLKDPPAPVLAIRYGIRKRTAMNRVVVPVHLQQTSHRALDLAAREAAEVHLVTVCSDEDQGRADEMLRTLTTSRPNTKTAVIRGKDPQDELLRYVVKVDADAIFINAAAEPSDRKIDIVRHAPVPVMIV